MDHELNETKRLVLNLWYELVTQERSMTMTQTIHSETHKNPYTKLWWWVLRFLARSSKIEKGNNLLIRLSGFFRKYNDHWPEIFTNNDVRKGRGGGKESIVSWAIKFSCPIGKEAIRNMNKKSKITNPNINNSPRLMIDFPWRLFERQKIQFASGFRFAAFIPDKNWPQFYSRWSCL